MFAAEAILMVLRIAQDPDLDESPLTLLIGMVDQPTA